MTQRCIWCMQELNEGSQTCSACHKSQTVHPALYHLPPGTCLQQRYVLGAVLYEDELTLTYAAWDRLEKRSMWIIEFFPRFLASRIAQTSADVQKEKDGYEEAGQEFVRILYGMEKSRGLSNVLLVEGLFHENNTAYAITPALVSPQPLETALQIPVSDPADLIDLLRPVLKDLYILHKKGIVHSRIRSQWIFLCEGKPVLAGFGLQVSGKYFSVQEHPEIFAGASTAPEQLSSSVLSPAADVYALGALFYRLLSGQDPEAASFRLFEERYIPLHSLRNDLPEAFCAAIDKALALDTRTRYPSLDPFLQDMLAGLPEESGDSRQKAEQTPVSGPEQKKQRLSGVAGRHHTAVFWCGICLVVAGLVLSTAGVYQPSDQSGLAVQEEPGIFTGGLLSADAIENLQAVDTSTLVLKDCDFSSLDESVLSTNPIITSLTIENPENLTDLSFLQFFPRLEQLVMKNCGITDAMLEEADLSRLSGLETLDLSGNRLSTISFAADLPVLQTLRMADNVITDMSPLRELSMLRVADLSGNALTDFVPLQSSQDMVVDVSGNQIRSIEPADTSCYYTLLSIWDNPLFDGDYEDYSSLSLLAGTTLLVSYTYSESHLAEDGTELAAYVLTFDGFQDNQFVDAGTASRAWIESYFAGKQSAFIDAAEAEKITESALRG